MKKFILSFFVIAFSIAYGINQQWGRTATSINTASPEPPKPTPSEPTPPSAETPAPTSDVTGQYKNGEYTGSEANAYYGYIQTKAVIQSGKLTDIAFLSYPSDRRTSQYINSYALPVLKSEAISAQSAEVDIVSGATDSSLAFRQSLADALAQAKK